jgi:hypothetical protein
MNWYKFSRISTETYFDIGFNRENDIKNQDIRLWVWIKGKLVTAPIKNKDDTHGIFSFIDTLDNMYRGRFQNKTVTIVKPIGIASFLRIPNILLNLLYEEFGDDIKIIEE